MRAPIREDGTPVANSRSKIYPLDPVLSLLSQALEPGLGVADMTQRSEVDFGPTPTRVAGAATATTPLESKMGVAGVAARRPVVENTYGRGVLATEAARAQGPVSKTGRTSAGGKASHSGVRVNADTTGVGEGRVHPDDSLFARRTARPLVR